MNEDLNKHVNPESLLIITKEGILQRLRCPFKCLLIYEVENLHLGETYQVQAVLLDKQSIMLYVIRGNTYYYYYFIIL